ncbi:MAG TPA: C40 family peptidase, partial [Leptospiraceae bacterium]|nr:C40 family peptidase [Leptospiraceae bacterium]
FLKGVRTGFDPISSDTKNMKRAILIFLLVSALKAQTTDVADRKVTLYDGQGITELAQKYLGVPYRFGGQSPDGFDCSGLTGYVYKKAGYQLPRDAGDQFKALRPIKTPRPGDLVFFKIDGKSIGHVGIYLGNLRFIHAPSTGKTVSIADMRISYWKTRYAGARTIFGQAEAAR